MNNENLYDSPYSNCEIKFDIEETIFGPIGENNNDTSRPIFVWISTAFLVFGIITLIGLFVLFYTTNSNFPYFILSASAYTDPLTMTLLIIANITKLLAAFFLFNMRKVAILFLSVMISYEVWLIFDSAGFDNPHGFFISPHLLRFAIGIIIFLYSIFLYRSGHLK